MRRAICYRRGGPSGSLFISLEMSTFSQSGKATNPTQSTKLNFQGSDTMSAAYYAQYHLNDGKPVATSIPATEHSVMTAHVNEKEAIKHMIETYGGGVFAIVMDSYDYTAALEKILPTVAKRKVLRLCNIFPILYFNHPP